MASTGPNWWWMSLLISRLQLFLEQLPADIWVSSPQGSTFDHVEDYIFILWLQGTVYNFYPFEIQFFSIVSSAQLSFFTLPVHFHQEALLFFIFCHKGGVICISEVLIFLPAILIPACASSSPAFLMMYSAYKLNKQGDNIQVWWTPFLFRTSLLFHIQF